MILFPLRGSIGRSKPAKIGKRTIIVNRGTLLIIYGKEKEKYVGLIV
jgi:hypothetical protein